MNSLRALVQLSLADFRERTRRTGFLATMLGVLFFAYLVITGKYTVQFGDIRTLYHSAWAGSLMAVTAAIMLALVGFYLVRGTITRDRRTQVGQIIAATSIRGRAYLFSKFVSNVAVLWFMAATLAAVAFVTLLVRNETGHIDLWAYIEPFIIITVPATIFVASLAVLFDAVPWLRGSAGNVIYLFVAETVLILGMLEVPLLDLAAVSSFTESVRTAVAAAYPGEKMSLIMGFVAFDPAMHVDEFRIVPWDGIDWSTQALQFRLVWLGLALVVLGISLPFFDRFDPARAKSKSPRRKVRSGAPDSDVEWSNGQPGLAYEAIAAPTSRFRPVRMITAELRLALKGRHLIWYAVALGLVVAQLVSPFEVGRLYLTPAAMVWPLLVWSAMGTRESHYNTGELMYSSPYPMAYQFPAIWAAGFVVALASVGGMIVRGAIAGHGQYAAALLLAALVVPSAALALGTLTGGKRMFEVMYLMVWYVGSIEHLNALDLLGTTDGALANAKLVALSLVALGLLVTAFLARRLQMARA